MRAMARQSLQYVVGLSTAACATVGGFQDSVRSDTVDVQPWTVRLGMRERVTATACIPS